MRDAEICKEKGFQVGDILEGDEGYGPTRILITAIGLGNILALEISHNGKPSHPAYERNWTLQYRDWKKVGRQE